MIGMGGRRDENPNLLYLQFCPGPTLHQPRTLVSTPSCGCDEAIDPILAVDNRPRGQQPGGNLSPAP